MKRFKVEKTLKRTLSKVSSHKRSLSYANAKEADSVIHRVLEKETEREKQLKS